MTSKELRAQRAKLIADARAIYSTAETAKREPTAEERGQFETIMGDADKLEARFLELERLEAAEKSVSESLGRKTEAEQPGRKAGETRTNPLATEEYRAAYDLYLRTGEMRALQADNDASGGYLLAPQQMVSDIIKALDNTVAIRALATKYTVNSAQSLGVPTLDADPADADWTSELLTGSEDTTLSFGKRELHPKPLAKLEKISNKLLRMAVMSAEQIVRDRLTYKFGVTEEKAFLTGNGANQPLGVFTASANGISTGRDVSTDNTSTAITADGLINAKYALKGAYHKSPNLRWMFHRDAIKQIRKLKTLTDGQYVWQAGLQSGQPDTLLDVPVIMSEYVPNTFTTGLYVGILGDFSKYWIADAMTLGIQRLNELYAATNQVGFIGRLETDGMPVLEEAFVRVKLA